MNAPVFYPVLLIGFNRPEFIKKRLQEILSSVPKEAPIILVIDGPRPGTEDNLEISRIRNIVSEIENTRDVTSIFREVNLGCDPNMIKSVSEVLNEYKAVVLVEDDVSISRGFYNSVNEFLNEMDLLSNFGAISGFSPYSDNILRLNMRRKNLWRPSIYYCSWGSAITRKFWESFEVVTDVDQIYKLLKNSTTWNSLPKRKQRIWVRRFARGNFDFQTQLNLFKCDLQIAYPRFRIIENVGFNDIRSTHTKGSKPRSFLGQGFASDTELNPTITDSNCQNLFWRFVDSNVWAGDGIFSVRGRQAGIRTVLKSLAKKIGNVIFD